MIVFENVSFGYKRGINVLSGFSLAVPDGGRVCLFGKSGCGKSTVLRLAMGLAKPGSGRITGTEGLAVSAVFQEDRLIPWKTVLENVALFADGTERAAADGTESAHAGGNAATDVAGHAAAGKTAAQRTAEVPSDRAAYYLRALGLGDVLQSFPDELSGGMKRRVALARALAHSFDLLVLDEPFTGLDDAAKRNAIELVSREAEGKMVLLATHDLAEAQALGAGIIEL